MSEHTDKRSRKNRKPQGNETVQGEGDYQAARRYRREVTDFVGRDRSKGDDAADPGIMYPGRKPATGR
ncbi:MAG: hypothetical protein WA446_13305 [Steroidobacteraceae bacterium]